MTDDENKKSTGKIPDAINCSVSKEFTQIPNGLIRNPDISGKAKSLLFILLSNAQGWTSHITTIKKFMKEGEDAIRSGLSELEQAGYLARLKYRDKITKQFIGSFWAYTDCPGDFHLDEHINWIESMGYELISKNNNLESPDGENPYVDIANEENPALKIPNNKNTNNKNKNHEFSYENSVRFFSKKPEDISSDKQANESTANKSESNSNSFDKESNPSDYESNPTDNKLTDVSAQGRKSNNRFDEKVDCPDQADGGKPQKPKSVNGNKSIRQKSTERKPRSKSEQQYIDLDKKFSNIVKVWNNRENLTNHKKFKNKDSNEFSKKYKNILIMLNKLTTGNLNVSESIKCQENGTGIIPKAWFERKWKKSDIIHAIKTLNQMHYADNWPPMNGSGKKNVAKDLDAAIFNPNTQTSWLMIAFKNYLEGGAGKVEKDPFEDLSEGHQMYKDYFLGYYNRLDPNKLSTHQKKKLLEFFDYALDKWYTLSKEENVINPQDAREFSSPVHLLAEFAQYLQDNDYDVSPSGLPTFLDNWLVIQKGIQLIS